MDFKEILERWEKSPQGKKAVDSDRFSHILKEKEEGLQSTRHSEKYHKAELKKLPCQDVLDLHGYTVGDVEYLVKNFIQSSIAQGFQKVLIIHGKGLHSAQGKSLLKEEVKRILHHQSQVLSYGQASAKEGGSGALWVVLRSQA